MRFYTNVHQRFNEILVRGYENGKHFTLREEFNPTFYVPSKKDSKYKTLENKSVEPVKPGNIAECKEFIEKYSGAINSIFVLIILFMITHDQIKDLMNRLGALRRYL